MAGKIRNKKSSESDSAEPEQPQTQDTMAQQFFTTDQQQERNTEKKVIQLGSEVSIHKDLEQLKSSFMDGFSANGQIVITANEKVNGDIAFIQLLVAAKKKAEQKNISFKLDFEFNQDYSDLLDKSGLLTITQ
jgi:hypothetical protein